MVREVASNVEHFVGRIRTDNLHRFGREALFIALRTVAEIGAVGGGALNVGGVPDGRAGVDMLAARSNDEIFTLFKPGIDRGRTGVDRHVLIAGLTVVGQVARNGDKFRVNGIDRAVVDVRAADIERLVFGIAAELIETAFIDENFVPIGNARRPVLTAFGDVQPVAGFVAGIDNGALAAVVARRDDEIVEGRFTRSRRFEVAALDVDGFGIGSVINARVFVAAENVERFVGRSAAPRVRAALFDRDRVPDGRAGIDVFGTVGNDQVVALFETVVDGTAARRDRHVVVSGTTAVGFVGDAAGHGGHFRVRRVERAGVVERSVDNERFAFGVAADLESFAFFRSGVGSRSTLAHRHVVPDGRAGVRMLAARSDDEIFTLFKAGVDRRSAVGDRHVLITGVAVVGDVARDRNEFGVFGFDSAVVDVDAADFKRLVFGIAAEMVDTARIDSNGVPVAHPGHHMLAACGDRQMVARFRTVVRNGGVVDVLFVVEPTCDREVVPGCRGAVFVREIADHRHAFGLGRVDFAAVGVVARNLEERFAERIGTDDVAAALFNDNFVPNGRADVRVNAAVVNDELVTGFVAFVEGRPARSDRHVVVAGNARVGEIARHIGHIRFGSVETARVREAARVGNREGVALRVGTDLETFSFFERRVRAFAGDGHLIPDGGAVVRPARVVADRQLAALFVAVVRPVAHRDRRILIMRRPVVVERARKRQVGFDDDGARFGIRNGAGKHAVRERADVERARVRDDGVDRARGEFADVRNAVFTDVESAVIVRKAIGREAARNVRRAVGVVDRVRVQNRPFRHVDRAFVVDVPHGEFAVLRDEAAVFSHIGRIDPAGRRIVETVRAERKRPVGHFNVAAVGSVDEEFVVVAVIRRPVEIIGTRVADKNKVLAALDADVFGIGNVLEADRVVDAVFARLRGTADHETGIGAARGNRVVVQRRLIEDDARIKHPRMCELFLLFLERRRRIDREVAHEVAEEMLLDARVFVDHARIGKRIEDGTHELRGPVFVVPDNDAAVFKADARGNRILDVGYRRRGDDVGDDVDLARFRIDGIDVDDGRRNLFEELIERRLNRAARTDRDRLIAGMCAFFKIDVVDVEHAARTDVDDRVGVDSVNLHDHIAVGPVLFFRGRTFVEAFVKVDRGRAGDVDRVLAEHAGSVAFVVMNDRGVELAALEIERRVLEPALFNVVVGRRRLREGHAFGVGHVGHIERTAAHSDLRAFLSGKLVDRGDRVRTLGDELAAVCDGDRVARQMRTVVFKDAALGNRGAARDFDRPAGRSGERTGNARTRIDVETTRTRDGRFAARHLKRAAVDRRRAFNDVAAVHDGAVFKRHVFAVRDIRNVDLAGCNDRAGVFKAIVA